MFLLDDILLLPLRLPVAGFNWIDRQPIKHLDRNAFTLADQAQQHVFRADVATTVLRCFA